MNEEACLKRLVLLVHSRVEEVCSRFVSQVSFVCWVSAAGLSLARNLCAVE